MALALALALALVIISSSHPHLTFDFDCSKQIIAQSIHCHWLNDAIVNSTPHKFSQKPNEKHRTNRGVKVHERANKRTNVVPYQKKEKKN